MTPSQRCPVVRARLRTLAAAIVGVSLLAAACTDDGPEDSAGSGADEDIAEDAGVTVEVTHEPSPDMVLGTMLTVTTDPEAIVQVTAVSGDHEVALPRTSERTTSHRIPVVGLRADRAYDITAQAVNDDGDVMGEAGVEFTTGALPEFIPEFTENVNTEGRSPGVTFVEIGPNARAEYAEGKDPLEVQHVVALDSDNEVVWYQAPLGAIGDVKLTDDGTIMSVDFPFAVRETDVLGNVVNYWGAQPEVMPWMDVAAATGDGDGEPVDRPDPTIITSDDVDIRSFHHEAFPMPDGNVLALAVTLHELTPEQREQLCPGDPEEFWAISDVVVEFTPEGEVVRTWDLWDVIAIMETPGEEMCATQGQIATEIERDWGHGNAVIYDPERDAVIVSTRHTSQIVAMPHGSDEGPQTELLWTIGTNGTIPLDGDVPRYQHAVELQDDGSILFYDNGNGRQGTAPGTENPPYSRAAIYEVDDSSEDPSEWTATQTWEHRIHETPGAPVFAAFLGDADRLGNGNVLVDHGGIPRPNPEDDHNRCMIVEVVPDDSPEGGEVVWDLRVGTAERPVTCYRTHRVPSLYAGAAWQ